MLRVTDLTIARGSFSRGPLSFERSAGSVAALVGPNGCGKSTLLETIAGLLAPSRGTIDGGAEGASTRWTDGETIVVPPHLRSIGYLPQGLGLWPHLSIREQGALCGGADRERSDRLAAELSIEELLDRRPEKLSGGEAQRAALWRTLVAAPNLLLLDEPTSAQFPESEERVRAVIAAEAARGAAVIVATHRAWPDAEELGVLVERL